MSDTPRTNEEWLRLQRDYNKRYRSITFSEMATGMSRFAETLERELAEVTKQRDAFRDELSKVMPEDYKDWWENDKNEWPLVARLSIENKDRLIQLDHEINEGLLLKLAEVAKQRAALVDAFQLVWKHLKGERIRHDYITGTKEAGDLKTLQQVCKEALAAVKGGEP